MLSCIHYIDILTRHALPSSFSALAALVAVSQCCIGQAGRAELFGAIQDPQGLAAAQAKVRIQDQATGSQFDVVTDGTVPWSCLAGWRIAAAADQW